jgi:hypothetical protein
VLGSITVFQRCNTVSWFAEDGGFVNSIFGLRDERAFAVGAERLRAQQWVAGSAGWSKKRQRLCRVRDRSASVWKEC